MPLFDLTASTIVSQFILPVLPVLHGSGGYPTGALNSNWRPEPQIVLGVFALLAAYLAWTGPLNRRRPDAAERPVTTKQRVAFITGCVITLIALGPPLADWADDYLLSAHMFQHMILIFVVAPLWLVGTPSWVLEPLTRMRVVSQIGSFITRPAVAFLLGNMVIAVWHLPAMYDYALRYEVVHALQHGSFIPAALLAWWPILSPLPQWPRLSRPLQCLYLFLQTIPGGLIGALITLSAPGIYGYYELAPRLWGIGLADDQEGAGLMMWVGGGLLYLGWITVIFFRWASDEEAKESKPASRRPIAPAGSVSSIRAQPSTLDGGSTR
jgi:putative membrane protein